LEEVRLDTPDGQRLGAWLKAGQPGRDVVLLLHGHGGSRTGSLTRLNHLAQAGVTVFALSFRGHGDSTGTRMDFPGLRRDVDTAFAYLHKRFPHERIKIMGTSLGAGAALMAAPDVSSSCAGYLLEAPFQDLDTAVRHRLDVDLGPGLSQLAYAGLWAWSPLFVPGGLKNVNPCLGAAAILPQTPLVVLAGGSDRRAYVSEAQAILAQYRGHGLLVVVPGADHSHMIDTNPTLYWKTVDDWVRG
jgi:alpha-beta hydrolase superfamily lysophospholipase